MIVKVWEPPGTKPEPEKVVRLRLVDSVDGVVLEAADEKGQRIQRSTLIKVHANGLERDTAVNPALGFPLDASGRIRLVGED